MVIVSFIFSSSFLLFAADAVQTPQRRTDKQKIRSAKSGRGNKKFGSPPPSRSSRRTKLGETSRRLDMLGGQTGDKNDLLEVQSELLENDYVDTEYTGTGKPIRPWWEAGRHGLIVDYDAQYLDGHTIPLPYNAELELKMYNVRLANLHQQVLAISTDNYLSPAREINIPEDYTPPQCVVAGWRSSTACPEYKVVDEVLSDGFRGRYNDVPEDPDRPSQYRTSGTFLPREFCNLHDEDLRIGFMTKIVLNSMTGSNHDVSKEFSKANEILKRTGDWTRSKEIEEIKRKAESLNETAGAGISRNFGSNIKAWDYWKVAYRIARSLERKFTRRRENGSVDWQIMGALDLDSLNRMQIVKESELTQLTGKRTEDLYGKTLYLRKSLYGNAADVTVKTIEDANKFRGEEAGSSLSANLEINLTSLRFDDHTLFSDEDYLHSSLQLLHDEYSNVVLSEFFDQVDKRIASMLPLEAKEGVEASLDYAGSITSAEPTDTERDGWLKAFSVYSENDLIVAAEEVIMLLNMRHNEWVYTGELLSKMWYKWNQLKSLRQRQGYVSTPVLLKTQQLLPVTVEGTANEDAKVYPQFLSHYGPAQLNPRDDEKRAWVEIVKSLDSWIGVSREKISEDNQNTIGFGGVIRRDVLCAVEALLKKIGDAEGGFSQMTSDHTSNENGIFLFKGMKTSTGRSRVSDLKAQGRKILQRLWDVRSGEVLYNPKEAGGVMGDGRDYAFSLVQDARQITDDTLVPQKERRRRRHVTESSYFVRILVNGRELEGKKQYSSIRSLQWPSFKVDFNESVAIRPHKRPSAVEMQLHKSSFSKLHAFSEHVATVMLPIPGSDTLTNVPATSVGPVRGPFQFASRSSMSIKHQARQANSLEDLEKLSQRHVMGRVEGDIRWTNGIIPDVPIRMLVSEKNLQTVTGISDSKERNRKHAAKLSAAAAGAYAAIPQQNGVDDARRGVFVDPNDPQNRSLVETSMSHGHATRTSQGGRDNGPAFRESMIEYQSAFVTPHTAAEAGVGVSDIVGTNRWPVKADKGSASSVAFGHQFSSMALQVLEKAAGPSSLFGGGKRQRLLKLRSKYPKEFNHEWHLPIPMSISDIKNNSALQRLLALEEQGQFGKETSQEQEDEDIAFGNFTRGAGSQNAATRLKVRAITRAKEYLSRVRQSEAGYRKYHSHTEMSHVVKDVELPMIQSVDLDSVANAFKPVRPLNPAHKQRKTSKETTLSQPGGFTELQTVKIRLQIAQARNLPVRATEERSRTRLIQQGRPPLAPNDTSLTPAVGEQTTYEDVGNANDTLCFVEARFRGYKTRTRAVAGESPIWNQVLEIPFRPPGDNISPSILATMKDEISLSLFDEELTEGHHRSAHRTTTSTSREMRYLGTIRFPFNTLFTEKQLTGDFRLRTPPVVFGYSPFTETDLADRVKQRQGDTSVPTSNKKSLQSNAESNLFASHITFAATFEPALPSPPVLEDEIAEALGVNRWKRMNMRQGVHQGIISKHQAVPRPMSQQSTITYLLSFVRAALGCNRKKRDDGNQTQQTRASEDTASTPKVTTTFLSESEYMDKMRYAFEWARKHRNNGKNVKAVVENVEKKPRLLTQYLVKQSPPPFLDYSKSDSESDVIDDLGATWVAGEPYSRFEQCLRYVSMIPYLGDYDMFGRNADILATSAQTLDMGAADWEEHAVLLHNYFLYLESGRLGGAWNTFLATGKTLFDGGATFVVRANLSSNEVLLLDPLSGIVYNSKDNSSPFIQLDMLATPTNCYANIQTTRKPWKMHFDVTNKSEWHPLWSPESNPTSDISTVQTPIKYIKPSLQFASNVSFFFCFSDSC